MEKLCLKVNILMIRKNDMENIILKMEHIIQDNLEMVYLMEKYNMKGILLMVKEKVK